MIKKVCLVVLCLTLVSASIAVAESETGRSRHDRELMFGVRGLDNIGLTSYGGELGLRYFLGERLAVRPSFALMNMDRVSPHYDDDYSDRVSNEDQYTIDLILERYLESNDRLTPYWGVGFSYDWSEYESSGGTLPDPTEGTMMKQTTERSMWAVLGVLGAQWKLHEQIRLGAEYKLRYYQSKNETEAFRYDMEPDLSVEEFNGFGSYTSSLYLTVLF